MAHRRVAVAPLVLAPLAFLGYGTDIDVANILRAGRRWIEDGDYAPSRPPGSVVHEVGVALLDRIGGSIAIGLVSIALAGVAVWAVGELVAAEGGRWPGWVAAALLANPWFIVAATSLSDAVWALAAALGAAVAAQRDRRVLAGVLFGLAIGCRGSTALVVGAWLLAERTGRAGGRPPWRASVVTAGVAGAIGVLAFVPAWLSAGMSLDFLETHFEWLGWTSHLGRWFVKNLAVMTVPGALALAIGGPALWFGLRRWTELPTVRFAVVVVVLGEALFLRLPFKPVHLLPVVAAAVLLAAASDRRWLLPALVAAQVVGGAVGLSVARPNVDDRATRGHVELDLVRGPLWNDIGCRLDDRDLGPWPDPSDPAEEPAAQARATGNFACQSRAWKSGSADGAETRASMRP